MDQNLSNSRNRALAPRGEKKGAGSAIDYPRVFRHLTVKEHNLYVYMCCLMGKGKCYTKPGKLPRNFIPIRPDEATAMEIIKASKQG